MLKAFLKDYKLLPRNYEERRQQILVVDSLKIKKLPNTRKDIGGRNELQNHTDIRQKAMVLATKKIGTQELITYINKIKPHALYELMLFSSGTKSHSGLKDHSRTFQAFILKQIGIFAQFAHAQKLTPVASWSYDPETHDRESLQHEKRFHMHLVCRRKRGVKFASTHTTNFKHLSINRQRRICDESSILVSEIAREQLQTNQSLNILEVVHNTNDNLSEVLLKLRVRGGWESFFEHDLAYELTKVEHILGKIQTSLKEGVTMGVNGLWQRAKLKSDEEIQAFVNKNKLGMSSALQKLTLHFYKNLQKQTRIDDAVAKSFNRDALTYLYPLAGPAHSVTITENGGEVYIYIRPALYSDLGGAGVCVINNTIVKLKKGVGTFSDNEVNKRTEFQEKLLKKLL